MTSLLDAIEKKYTQIDDVPQQDDGSFVIVLPKAGPRECVPNILVLDNCSVSSAGDEKRLIQILGNVHEIDLSQNYLENWSEVSKILRLTPSVTFLNLSFNNLSSPLSPSLLDMSLNKLHSLVLVSTNIKWETIWTLLEVAKNLQELHLSLNNFLNVELPDPQQQYTSVTKLMLNGNAIDDWIEVSKLGFAFPELKHFNLSECPIRTASKECLEKFEKLETINLCDTLIKTCEDILCLNNFPNLSEIRLTGIPYLQDIAEKERRQELVALLPKISKLNGGVIISDVEREGAERFYIRKFHKDSTLEKTLRYHQLVEKHGELDSLVEVSLKPKKTINLNIKFKEITIEQKVNTYQTVRDFKKSLELLVGLEGSRMQVYFLDLGLNHGREILRFPDKQLYTYNMRDGDEIYVEIKNNTNRDIKS